MKLKLIGRPIAINDRMISKNEVFEIDDKMGVLLAEDKKRFIIIHDKVKDTLTKGD